MAEFSETYAKQLDDILKLMKSDHEEYYRRLYLGYKAYVVTHEKLAKAGEYKISDIYYGEKDQILNVINLIADRLQVSEPHDAETFANDIARYFPHTIKPNIEVSQDLKDAALSSLKADHPDLWRRLVRKQNGDHTDEDLRYTSTDAAKIDTTIHKTMSKGQESELSQDTQMYVSGIILKYIVDAARDETQS